MSAGFTARIPRELKEGMNRLSHVNWSDVVRRALEEVKWALGAMDEVSPDLLPTLKG